MEAQSEDTTKSSLPLILVSAYDLASANALISEITNNSIKDTKETSKELHGCVWQIVNKYYEVDVELYPVADNDTLPPSLAERLEAHIIYITDDEELIRSRLLSAGIGMFEQDGELGAERAEQRRARAGAAAAGAGVRLAVAAGARAAPALAAWARRRRYEPVALREAAGDDDDAGPDTYGAERARAALHAHTWRGLRRTDAPTRNFLPLDPMGATSSDEECSGEGEWGDGEWGEGEWEGEVERAEAFAEALGALGGARAAAARLPAAERRRRAERLVLAFCRALGADLHAL